MNHIHEAVFWLLAALLWWYFYGLHRRYWIDKTRCRLFVIRDALFHAAADGVDVRFEDHAYGMTRQTLNGMIRTLEDWDIVRLVLLARRYAHDPVCRSMAERYREETRLAVEALSPRGRTLIEDTMEQANRALLRHMVQTSLALWVLSHLHLLRRALGRWYRAQWRQALDVEANIAGTRSAPSHVTGAMAT